MGLVEMVQNSPEDDKGLHVDPLYLSALASLESKTEQKVPTVTTSIELANSIKPSVAVLPFNNMSGDPEQEYFSDGITEDIITELSRFKDLFVISRNSSFQFKGRSVKVQEVGKDLSAKYVVEGSVRKSGNRVRITAQLIETASDNHIWAERYDRDLTDIFEVQDEVVTAIAQAIPGQVSQQVLETVKRKPPENLSAYEYELRGRWAYLHWVEGLASAISWYEKAVAADPDYAPARSGLGLIYAYSVYVLGNEPSRMFPLAREQISRAVAGGGRMPRVHQQAATAYHLMGAPELALTHAERALALNPNDPMVLQTMGDVLSYCGRMAEALEWYAKSATIEPHAADDQRLDNICDTYYMLEQYEKVLEIHNTYQNVPAFLNAILAAALAQLGRIPEARAALEKFYGNLLPGQDPVLMAKTHMSMCSRKKDADLWAEGYRKAGLLV
jgi:TolB-like protein